MRKKRFLSGVLAVTTALATITASFGNVPVLSGTIYAVAAENEVHTSGDYSYVVLDDDTAEITQYNPGGVAVKKAL